MSKRLLCWWTLLLLGLPAALEAHVGDPNIIYEGKAGPFPLRVIVRLPGVVPGLAEISVRTFSSDVTRVTVLPVFWRAGKEGSPPPDVAHLVAGETNLYNAQLWLMAPGSYSVYVNVAGPEGQGTAIVPINSMATTRREMSRPMGGVLLGLGLALLFGAMSIVGAALRESVLEPGEQPSTKRLWIGRGASLVTGLFLVGALYGGWSWWSNVDRDYRTNRLYRALKVEAAVENKGTQRLLRLTISDPRWSAKGVRALVPDHGKMMHAYLIREPELNAMAHLHPVRKDSKTFGAVLPPLPPGRYQLYADVTQESGLAQTLTAQVDIRAGPETAPAITHESKDEVPDPDDSYSLDQPVAITPSAASAAAPQERLLPGAIKVIWQPPAELRANRDVTLRFDVLDEAGQPVELEPYLNMLSHAAIRRYDGAVFTHLHPAGSISVAAQQLFELRDQGKSPAVITAATLEPFCKVPTLEERRRTLTFPYAFPKEGRYRMWVQIKVAGTVRTAVFDLEVGA